MSSPKRFPNGETNVVPRNTLGSYIDTDPTKVITFFDGSMPYTATGWVKTATSVVGTSSLTDATDVAVGFYWDGVDTFKYYIDDVEKGTLSSGTIPDDEYMAVSFGCQNGEATANTMAVDYIFMACER